MTYHIVNRSQHQRGGKFGGPNAYMALVEAPDDSPSPHDYPLSEANLERFGWRIMDRGEYWRDGRKKFPGKKTYERLDALRHTLIQDEQNSI